MNNDEVIIRDISCIIDDYRIIVNKNKLSKYEFWNLLLNPSRYGFKHEDNIIFPYDSNINSLSDIQLLIDVLHDISIISKVDQDIRIAILLNTYANKELYMKFCDEKLLSKQIFMEDLSYLSIRAIIMKYSYPSRWIEANIIEPFIDDIRDKYVRLYKSEMIHTDVYGLEIYVNERTLYPYISQKFLDLFCTKTLNTYPKENFFFKENFYYISDGYGFYQTVIFNNIESFVKFFDLIGSLEYLFINTIIEDPTDYLTNEGYKIHKTQQDIYITKSELINELNNVLWYYREKFRLQDLDI